MSQTQGQHSSRAWSRAMAWGERCLWLVAIAALGYAAFVWGEAIYAQADGNRTLGRYLQWGHAHGSAWTESGGEGSLVGRIEVPRLGLSAVIFEGTSDGTLTRGVGHLKSSALPGRTGNPGSPGDPGSHGNPGSYGNVVLAGHRDTFFRPLRQIHRGDAIALTTTAGVFHYRVASMEVVAPQQTEVLGSVPGTDLTLITCYPFRYVGSAPDRYIVRGQIIP